MTHSLEDPPKLLLSLRKGLWPTFLFGTDANAILPWRPQDPESGRSCGGDLVAALPFDFRIGGVTPDGLFTVRIPAKVVITQALSWFPRRSILGILMRCLGRPLLANPFAASYVLAATIAHTSRTNQLFITWRRRRRRGCCGCSGGCSGTIGCAECVASLTCRARVAI